jgi:hypothetical protein
MSVRRLHELLREQARDDQITLDEVGQLIAEARREGSLTPGERLTLEAALEAHRAAFTPEALKALVSYLGERSS